MKLLVDKKISLLLFFAAIILVSVVVVFYYNSRKVKLTSDLVEHTQDVLRKSDNVLLDVINIETGLRGYILSDNEIFLEPYKSALTSINPDLQELTLLCKNNVSQQTRIDSLKKAIEIRLAFTEKINKALETDAYTDLEKIETLEQGKFLSDNIRTIIAAINTEEFQVLKQSRMENEKSNDYSQLILLLLLIFILVIFGLVFIILQNQRQRNLELEAHNASQQLLLNYSLSLIEASLDPLVTINTEGKITDMNEATVTVTGFSRKELKGTDFFNYFTDPQKAREVYQGVFANGSVADKPLTLRHKDGKLTDVSFNGSVYKDDHGKVLGVVVIARDIAEQKWALELQKANKELAFQNDEKEKRAQELRVANLELAFQNEEKEKRATELVLANNELAFQNEVEEKRAAELVIANKELLFQIDEKGKRAAEVILAEKELVYQIKEKEKQELANIKLEAISNSLKLAFQYSLSLIEASLDPLVTISPEGKITDMNEALVNITGISRQNLTGTDFFNYFTDPQKAREVYQEVFAKGSVADSPLTLRHKGGKLTDVLFNGSVYKDDNGNVMGVVIVARDVTAQKLLSNYSLSLIEASRDPLFTISPDGKITDMNEATVKVTGVSREALIGTDFFNYFTEPDKASKAYQQAFDKGFIVDYPLTITDGKLMDVLCNGSVYKDDRGNVLGVVIVARDITDQKRIATELSEAIVFAELAVAIAEEAKLKAESATLIAETAVKAKQQFLSNMSHEIRTPMNAIIGFTKVLIKTDTTSKQKEYLQAIKLSGDSLIVLINDILDLAKVDAGKMMFEQIPFKMAMSISAMLHLFEPKIREKNLELVKEYDTNIPAVLVGDPVRLHQIIINLVSNAVKFTNKGKINVSVRLVKEDDIKVTIAFAVKDTGIGIAQNKMGKIFDNFQQASSGTSRLYGGTGLGLAIVRQLVEAQDGSVRVESKMNEGTTFTFVMDFLKTKANADLVDSLVELDSEIKGIRVLVVEDIALNQLLMRTLLDDFGFQCDVAANGKIAVEKMQKKVYDIVLMDLQMPEMNGFEATDYIRNKMNSNIPIIALTADVTTVDLDKCRAVGMNDYIAKPVDEKVLYSKIVGEFKKTMLDDNNTGKQEEPAEVKILKYTDLHYLIARTKANPVLMMEMISLYLEQTPPLISVMKKSWQEKDWDSLYASVHKMIPSFNVMGISVDYENMAKKIQDFAKNQQQSEGIYDLVLQIDTVCTQACVELEAEYTMIKNAN